jgi:hypothetical protein
VFCALDDIGSASLRGLLSGRLVTYRWIHTPPERRLIDAGFTLLPTFGRPHFTVVLGSDSDDELGRLQRALGPRIENPYHQAGRIGR